jgi:hypothetical protein
MDEAGRAFLDSLSDAQRERCTFEFSDDERTAWTYLPGERQGLLIGDLSADARAHMTKLMQSALSSGGYLKAEGVLILEGVLNVLQPNANRDPGKYAVTVFGEPGEGPWGWTLEGHHLSLNFTANADGSRSTPLMFGVAPAIVNGGPHTGLRVLGAELDTARALINSLSKEQRESAKLEADRPSDVVMRPARSKALEDVGLPGSALNEEQQSMLLDLIAEYTGNVKRSASMHEMQRALNPPVLTGHHLGAVKFAYTGDVDSGLLYYRVTSGKISFEYAAIGNDPNHAHALWRDLDQDFGADLLREHLKDQH